MRKFAACAALLLLALPGALPGDKDKKEPFYRHFLVPGDPLDEAILLQERRIEEDPGNAALHNDMGVLLARRRFPEMAADEFRQAAKLDKKNWLAPYNLGLVLEAEGDADGALKAYKHSIERNPGFPQSLFRAGLLYEKNRNVSAAIDHYARALRIDPSMRNPEVNPRVIDSALMDRVAITNYAHDLDRARLAAEAQYAEPDRFRPPPPIDQPIASDEIVDSPAPPVIPPPIRYSSEAPPPEPAVEVAPPQPVVTAIPNASGSPGMAGKDPSVRRTRPPIVPAFGRPTPPPDPPVEEAPEPDPTPGPSR
jgi:tetratricopeptide (TPR) repeat protein